MDTENVSISPSDNPFDNFMRKHLQCYSYYQKEELTIDEKVMKEAREEEKNKDTEEADDDKFPSVRQESSLVSSDSALWNISNKCTLLDKVKHGIQGTTQLISTEAEGKVILKLQQPRSLHFMSQLLGAQKEAKWPRGLDAKYNNVKHLYIIPTNPEPFYEPSGLEYMPTVRGDLKTSKVVFENKRLSTSDISSPAEDPELLCCGNKPETSIYPAETELQFESRFESGNLAKVVRVGDTDYEVHLHFDLYTNSHTQWFYFQVTNTRKDIPYRFTIVNLTKSASLYSTGMRPLMYSEKSAAYTTNPVSWIRIGDNIQYYKNNLTSKDATQTRQYYSLTWTSKFPYDLDTVYFAHSYPYTYSDLQDYLFKCANDKAISKFFSIRILCQSLAGNNIYILTITNPMSSASGLKMNKKVVFVTCRVHPGESNASWVMKGFLDFLTTDSQESNVIPMLNPDGVIVGNSRCSLSGQDLNRNYRPSLASYFPSITNILSMVKKLVTKLEVVMYCDFHSHSRKNNAFFYGCKEGRRKGLVFTEKIFPYLLAKNTPNHFLFKSCKFKVQRCRKRTSRVIMWKLGITNSFTFEVSCCGSTIGQKKGFHFNIRDYELLGKSFLNTLLEYENLEVSQFNDIYAQLKYQYKSGKMPVEKDSFSSDDDEEDEAEEEEVVEEVEDEYKEKEVGDDEGVEVEEEVQEEVEYEEDEYREKEVDDDGDEEGENKRVSYESSNCSDSSESEEIPHESEEVSHVPEEISHVPDEISHVPEEISHESEEISHESEEISLESKEISHESKEIFHESKEISHESEEISHESKEISHESEEISHESKEISHESEEISSVSASVPKQLCRPKSKPVYSKKLWSDNVEARKLPIPKTQKIEAQKKLSMKNCQRNCMSDLAAKQEESKKLIPSEMYAFKQSISRNPIPHFHRPEQSYRPKSVRGGKTDLQTKFIDKVWWKFKEASPNKREVAKKDLSLLLEEPISKRVRDKLSVPPKRENRYIAINRNLIQSTIRKPCHPLKLEITMLPMNRKKDQDISTRDISTSQISNCKRKIPSMKWK